MIVPTDQVDADGVWLLTQKEMGMNTYLVGYDLNTPGQNYEELYEAIKAIGSKWWHYLDSTWLVKHDGPATDLRDALAPHIDSNDELLIVKLSGEGAWKGFSEKGSKWLKDNL